METKPPLLTIQNNQGIKLAYRLRGGRKDAPTLVFLCGYRSDMSGSKAEFLDVWAAENGLSYLRLDYSGHGESGGEFKDGTIGQWCADALTVIDNATEGPLIVVGSSMGGWIGLLVSIKRAERVKAFLGIAAAPDFTKWVWDHELTPEQRERCKRDGFISEPSPYSDKPDIMTMGLFEDGAKHLVLDKPIPFDGPVTLLHGKADTEVPYQLATQIAAKLKEGQTKIITIEDGEHRLSRDFDLEILKHEVEDIYSKY